MCKTGIILILLVCLTTISTNNNNAKKRDSKEQFVPSKEWKEIREGQKVPSGLHYRIDLSTGKKEAKILDDSAENPPNSQFTLQEGSDESENAINLNEAEQLLKDVDKKNPENDMPKKFRTLDEIKKDLGDIELYPKSDVELLRELFRKFEDENKKSNSDENVIIGILHDLKYLGHQIDNGNEFYKMDGFRRIIYKELNSTSIAIKQESLKLFSVLVQNNPKVKVHILETGGITMLLRILNYEKQESIKKSALTALSCTLRTFPYAQNKFIEIGGLKMFVNLLKTESVSLKLKIVTLLNDLIIERQKDKTLFENHEIVDIENELYLLSWCSYLNELLQELVLIDVNDYDSIEKCLLAMNSMVLKCKGSYDNTFIIKLENQYKLLAKINQEDTENYFTYLSNLASSLIDVEINNKEEL